MKDFAIGLLGLLVGVVLGAGLVVAANSFIAPPVSSLSSVAAVAPSDLSITVGAQYASSEIQRAMSTSGLTKSATISFVAPDLVRLATPVQVNVLGAPLSITANILIRVSLDRGRIVLKTDRVDAGGFTIPSSVVEAFVEPLRAQAEDQVNRLAERALLGSSLHLSAIRITSETLTVEIVR